MSDSNKKALVRALMSGGVATLVASNMLGASPMDSVNVFGTELPLFVFVGGSVGLADFSANRVGAIIKPYLPKDEQMIFGSAAKFSEVVAAGLTTAVILTANSGNYTNVKNIFESFLVGAGSVAVSDWSVDQIYNMSSSDSSSAPPASF